MHSRRQHHRFRHIHCQYSYYNPWRIIPFSRGISIALDWKDDRRECGVLRGKSALAVWFTFGELFCVRIFSYRRVFGWAGGIADSCYVELWNLRIYGQRGGLLAGIRSRAVRTNGAKSDESSLGTCIDFTGRMTDLNSLLGAKQNSPNKKKHEFKVKKVPIPIPCILLGRFLSPSNKSPRVDFSQHSGPSL